MPMADYASINYSLTSIFHYRNQHCIHVESTYWQFIKQN